MTESEPLDHPLAARLASQPVPPQVLDLLRPYMNPKAPPATSADRATEDDFQYVRPEMIPELAAVLRAGLLSKVRLFEAVCERGHRFVQVLRIAGRPLALATSTPIRQKPGVGPHWAPVHRGHWYGLWLDAPDIIVTLEDGRREYRNRFEASCQDEWVLIPTPWLRDQIAAGHRRRVIDEATRREMVVPPKGEDGHMSKTQYAMRKTQ